MSKENFEVPQADDVVGVPQKYKEGVGEYLDDIFRNIGGKRIEEFEIDKSERDTELITLANKSVLEYLKKYGREVDLEVPLENIHLFGEGGVEKFTKGRLRGGVYSSLQGDIIVDRMKPDLDFILRVFHELFHAKSYKALQVTIGETSKDREFASYRSGFSVTSRDGKITYFKDVEEAVIGHMTKKFYQEILIKEEGFSEEIQKLTREGKKPDFSRSLEQEQGNKLVDKIYELNPNDFKTKEEVIDLFVEAQVTGQLMKVGRLIEKTFGKGSFRRLGEGKL